MNKFFYLIWFLFSPIILFGQNDSLPIKDFKNKIIWFGDLGFSTAPFQINYQYTDEIDKLKFRNNIRTSVGFGGAYKWFALRIAFSLPGNLMPVSRYGDTRKFDIGTEFNIKRLFFDMEFKQYIGFSIKNAYIWDSTLNTLKPNDIRPDLQTFSMSISSSYFRDKSFKIQALKGRSAMYTKDIQTWYFKNSLSIFSVSSDKGVIPDLLDETNSKLDSKNYSAIEFGFIPGYAMVKRLKNWQFGGVVGLGAVLQFNFHEINGVVRDNLWLAPRADIRLMGGYNVDRYYVMLMNDFDNKSIGIGDLRYRQIYYYFRIASGIRLEPNKKEKEKKKNKVK